MSPTDSENKINALFVDDERDLLELAQNFFEKEIEHIELLVAPSAEEGLDLMEEEQVDVVVSDYSMPEMDGIDFLEKLRSEGNDVPFIILTGQGEEDVAMRALNIGANRYQRKNKGFEDQFRELAQIITDEVTRVKSKKELKTFQTWIKKSIGPDSEDEELF